MLYLIGLGLSKNDISLKAVETSKNCEIYIERYTGYITDDSVRYLSDLLKKEINLLSRPSLEENSKELIRKARQKDIALFVEGDPLIATTHKILFIDAKKQNVKIKIIHSSSIITAAIGESGLDFYRFGAICTIARWTDHYKPISFYETIVKNINLNYHSLILLDFDEIQQTSISLKQIVEILKNAENHYKKNIFSSKKRILVMHNIGLDDQIKKLIALSDAENLDLNKGPTLIIVPAELSEIEEEIINSIN